MIWLGSGCSRISAAFAHHSERAVEPKQTEREDVFIVKEVDRRVSDVYVNVTKGHGQLNRYEHHISRLTKLVNIKLTSSAASLAPSSVATPAESPAHQGASGQAPGDKETTTLIHNEESFALAPVSLDWTNQRQELRSGDQ